MTLAEQRAIAMGAVRSQLRTNGKDPKTASMLEIEDTLDFISRDNPRLVAARWYNKASRHQWNLWRRDWKQWSENHVTVPRN